uniref:Transposase (Putative), gypsy type n=1 Tax=Tanacetum cinerariifolium TaxID=118510 RepID=A0A699HJ62_TANCI|nr:hypothetical protein [Tanacetum cinerariifolium]
MSTPTFAKTHNLIEYLAKPTESEGFEQIIDFLNGSSVKTINDEVRIQALIDEKRINIKESSIRRTIKLDDAKGTSCLANAEIFYCLAKMGYEKLFEKLTFYKAFFSPQWKFLIHTILQCLSAKTTAWNEFSSTMASAIIYLATTQKFNFSRYILFSPVKNIKAGVPFFMFPRFVQLLIDHQLGDMSHHKDIYDNPSLTKKVFANMKRIGTGFSGESITIPTEPSTSKPHKKHKSKKQQTQAPKVPSHEPSPEHRLPLPSNDKLPGGDDSLKLKQLMDLCTHLSNKVLELECEVIDIKPTYKEKIKKLEGIIDRLEEENKVLKDLHSVHSKVDNVAPALEKEKSFKQGRIIADIDEDVEINLEEAQAKLYRIDLEHPEKVLITTAGATTTAEVTKFSVPRRRRGVVIQDPKETTSTVVVHLEVQSKNKGKEEVNEEVTVPEKEVEVEGHKRKGKSLEKEITKKQKMDEEAEELKSYLQIVSNDDDDVYTEATPLASKIPIVDYNIHFERNKPYFKIIRADGNHMLFLSFSTLLKNFNREDLENLHKLVKERDQKGRYGLAKRYSLTHLTLEKMVSNVRLEVKEESEMSLELLRFSDYSLVYFLDEPYDPKKELFGYSSIPFLYQVNLFETHTRSKTPLALPWERIPRLDSGVRFPNQTSIYTPTTAYATYRYGTSPHQEYLLEFTSKCGISEALHPELPGPENRIMDFPEGKVDERVFPTIMDWRTSAPKDGMPAKNTYSPEAVMILNTHRTLIQKQPEALLCLLGLSRRYYLGDEVYPTFLYDDDRDKDLFNLIHAPNPTKVKTGTCPRATHEVSLLTVTASRVIEMEDPAAATDSSGTKARKQWPLRFLPLKNVTTTGVTLEAGQAERIAVTGPHVVKEHRKRGNDGVDINAPLKVLRRDHADPRPIESTREGKSLTAIELGMGSTRLVHASQDVIQSSKGVAAAGDPELENTSFTSMVGSPESIYRPKLGITNGCMLDAPKACQDLVDHIAPPGYFLEPRHLHNDDFLKQYNVNLARQVAMGSQLQLRFKQEAKLLKKSVAQVARRDKRIHARENEIKNLETLLEAKTDMKKAAKGRMSTLQAQVMGEEKLKAAFEEFKQYEDNRVKQRCAKMDARLDALSIDFDKELYPHMLTAIAGHRWVIGRGLCLAVMKCDESIELRQAFADVVSAGIAKGMSEELKHGVEHEKANLNLEAIEAYDPEAEAKYIAALHALKDLKYPIVDQLESLQDAPMDVIKASLYLESDTRDNAPYWIRELHPSSSQLMTHVYPKVCDPTDPWACKEEILLVDAISANVSRAEKKKKYRVVCCTHGVGSAHHARSDGVLVSVPTVAL